MKHTTLLLFLILGILVACTEPAIEAPVPAAVPEKAEAPVVKEPVQAPPIPEPVATEDPATLKLFEKNAQVKSVSFDVAVLPDKRGSHKYFIRGTKVKIDPIQAQLRDADVDVVFLDTATKQAAAYCIDSTSCDTPNDPIPQSYDEWMIQMPSDWIPLAKTGKIAKSLTFYSRPATVVTLMKDGQYYEFYIDNYFGYPLRVAVANNPEMTDIVSGYEYRNMAFNSIQESDVVHSDT